MQRTSSFLRNLLDVVEEVQIARLEIRNLTLTSFHCPSGTPFLLFRMFCGFVIVMTWSKFFINGLENLEVFFSSSGKQSRDG